MPDQLKRTRQARQGGLAGQSGFSLIELLISTTIMMFVIILASQVLLESQTLLVRSNREAQNALPGASMALLRADIYNAKELTGIPATPWVSVPLVLQRSEGTAVYQLNDGCLARGWSNKDQIFLGSRCVLQGVQSFSWRFAADSLIEAKVAILENKEPEGVARLDEIRMRQGGSVVRTYFLSAYGRASTTRSRQW